jgi:hypothetical protein
MTTRFSTIAKDWELTDTEREFLSNVIIQLRKSEAIGVGKTGRISFEQAIDAVCRAAYEAEVQYKRTFYHGHLRQQECLDRAHGFMTGVMIEFSRIEPIMRRYADKKKNGVL